MTRQIKLDIAAEAKEKLKRYLEENSESAQVRFSQRATTKVAEGDDEKELLGKQKSFFKKVDQDLKRSLAEAFLKQDHIENLSSLIDHYGESRARGRGSSGRNGLLRTNDLKIARSRAHSVSIALLSALSEKFKTWCMLVKPLLSVWCR